MFPTLALPGVLWMAVLFLMPFYVVLAVGAGAVDPIFRTPFPVWNPLQWSGGAFTFSLHQLASSSGILHTPALRTLGYTGIALLLCVLIGYPVAYTAARHAGRYRGLLLLALIAPFFISYLMRMLAWVNLLQDDGMVNRTLGLVGINGPNWLEGRPETVILGLVYGYIPYVILPLYGFLDAIDESVLESARDLGAGSFSTFRRVTLPLSKQGLVAATLIAGLPMLGDYYTNDLLSGSPHTTMVANQIDFLLHSQNQGPTIGAAMVLLLMAALVIPLLYYLRVVGGGHASDAI